MSRLRSLLLFTGVLFSSTYAYVDFGSLTLPIEPTYDARPSVNQLPFDFDVRYESLPSMITAVAPAATRAVNGSNEMMYTLHYHHLLEKKHRQGHGNFNKRGVFSGNPIPTCTPCGGSSQSLNRSITSSSTSSCSTVIYKVHRCEI
jgi:hypothetical protein